MSENPRSLTQRPIRPFVLVVLTVVGLVATAMIAGLAGAPLWPSSPGLPQGSSAPAQVLSVAPSAHAPFFPPHRPLAGIGNCTTTPVVPGCGFPAEPAPMGIADYGVSGYGNPTPYSYSTDIFLANMSWSTAYIYSSSEKADFSVQLNVVLNFINGGQNYSYWIQNVPVPTDTTKNDIAMSYANNIWNFSCASSTCNLATNTVTGNGTDSGGVYVWPASANSGCAGGKSGTCDTLDGPSYFDAEVRTFINPSGSPEVRFCYFDAKTKLSCYDTVTFGFAKKVGTFRGFLVDGYSMNPTGLFEDAEWEIGGPGNGASTTNTGPSNIHMSLDYWNGHNFQSVPSAWNGGDDTAEAVGSDQSIFTNDGSGTPLTAQLNGTTREAFENPAYRLDQVGTLQLWAPGTTTGYVAVQAQDWDYVNGDSTLTLVPGTYHVWANVTGGASVDMGMCTITASAVLNVSTAAPCPSGPSGGTPSVSAPLASSTSLDVGQTVSFSTTASGGTGSYPTYSWSVSPATGLACTAVTASGATSCTASAAGIYTVSVTVTDSGGATSSPASSLPFTVYPDPTVSVPSASSSSITLGQSVTFTTSLGLPGSGGDAYSWTAAPSSTAGCTSSTITSYACTPTAVGTYTATATVTDSNGGTGSNTSATVTVTSSGPSVSTPTASPASGVDVGQSVVWSATASGGTGPYTYAWSTSPASGLGCPTTGAPPITCTPTASGSYTLTVVVTDSTGKTGTASSHAYTVDADPTVSAPTFSAGSADVGQTVTVSATVTGSGSGGDTLAWSSSSSSLSCPSTGASPVTCDALGAGSSTVTVTVSDSNGGHGSATSLSFTVYALPAVSSPALSVTAPTVGESTVLTSTLTAPGSGGDTYGWTSSPSGLTCTAPDALSESCTAASAGTYTVVLTVTDSNGGTASASATLTVGAGGLDVSAHASPSPATAGATVSFSATVSEVSGGSGVYSYSWHFGDGDASTAVSPSYAYSTAGTYTVVLFVNDTDGHSGSTSFQLTVAPSTGTSSGGPQGPLAFLGPNGLWILLAAVVVVAVLVGVALARRKKGAQEAPPMYPYDGPGAPENYPGYAPGPTSDLPPYNPGA